MSDFNRERLGEWAPPPRCAVSSATSQCPGEAKYTLTGSEKTTMVCRQCLGGSAATMARRGPVIVEALPSRKSLVI